MKPRFYAAGVTTVWKMLEKQPIPSLNELVPFLPVRNKPEIFDKPRNSWFVDSSAYSIFTTGANVTLDDYIKFLHKVLEKQGDERNGGKIGAYAGLDVIGDPVAGDINQLKMEKEGLKPLATYHRGDNIDFLKKFLDRGYDYIAIGGMAIAEEYTSAESLFPFLDAVYREICDSTGKPRLKTHLFGICASKAVMRYPCFSFDGTSWMQPGIFGSIMLPKFVLGKPDWFETMIKVPVSNESNAYRKPDAHYKSMKPPMQVVVKEFIEQFGFSMDTLASDYEQRNMWNLKMAMEVAERMPSREKFDHMNDLDFNFL